MYSYRRGTDKTTPDKTFQTKDKTPGQSPREQLRENLYMGLLSGLFVLGLLKIGDPRRVTYFLEGSRDVCQSVTAGGSRGSKLAKSSVTYFMDGSSGEFGTKIIRPIVIITCGVMRLLSRHY